MALFSRNPALFIDLDPARNSTVHFGIPAKLSTRVRKYGHVCRGDLDAGGGGRVEPGWSSGEGELGKEEGEYRGRGEEGELRSRQGPEGASLRRDGRVIGQLSGKGRTYRNRYRSRSGGNDHCLGRGRAILALFWAWECSAASMISRVWRARCGGELLMAWPAIIWPSSSTAGMRVAPKFSA